MGKPKQHLQIVTDLRAVKGMERERFYAEGGTPAMYRGRANTFADRAKVANRQAARGRTFRGGDR